MRFTCVLTVSGLTASCSAISSLEQPAGDQGEHLPLAAGERRQPLGAAAASGSSVGRTAALREELAISPLVADR